MNDWPASDHAKAAMQLEATMRVLDTVDELRREVDALRAELPPRRAGIAVGVVVRVGVEAGILVAVAVIAGAGHFRPLLIVALMAAALACVVLSEWLASRSAFVPRSFGFAQDGPLLRPTARIAAGIGPVGARLHPRVGARAALT
jgi:hypothetical protein